MPAHTLCVKARFERGTSWFVTQFPHQFTFNTEFCSHDSENNCGVQINFSYSPNSFQTARKEGRWSSLCFNSFWIHLEKHPSLCQKQIQSETSEQRKWGGCELESGYRTREEFCPIPGPASLYICPQIDNIIFV